jgi:anti-sigma B factor antagonist
MRYTVEHTDNVVIFTLKNKILDSSISSQFKAEFLILAQPDIAAMILDFSYVDAIDSSGLSALLLAHRQLSELEVPVVLCGVKDMVRMLMSISQIDQLFTFYTDADEALAGIQDELENTNPNDEEL